MIFLNRIVIGYNLCYYIFCKRKLCANEKFKIWVLEITLAIRVAIKLNSKIWEIWLWLCSILFLIKNFLFYCRIKKSWIVIINAWYWIVKKVGVDDNNYYNFNKINKNKDDDKDEKEKDKNKDNGDDDKDVNEAEEEMEEDKNENNDNDDDNDDNNVDDNVDDDKMDDDSDDDDLQCMMEKISTLKYKLSLMKWQERNSIMPY